MAKIYLLPIGTTGDLLPMIWIGRQMKARGHEVVLFWLEAYRDTVQAAGLYFGGFGEDVSEEPIRNAGYWKMHEGLKLSYDFAGRCAVMCINAVRKRMEIHGKPDLLMAPIMSFAAPILRSRLGGPLISTHMGTLQLLSSYQVRAFGRLLRLLPLPVRRILLQRVALYDHLAKPRLRQCCTEPGEKPPYWLRDWFYSPDGSLVLFPSWYVPPQPDWPTGTYQWDFPVEDLEDSKRLDPDLVAFLDAGPPQIIVPMVFDQFDNAHFVEKLGAGLQLNLSRWSVANAQPLLTRCLEDEGIRRCAKECAERLRQRKPVSELADWIETKMKPAGTPTQIFS